MVKKLALQTTVQLIARSFTTLANFVTVLLIATGFGSLGLGQYNKIFAFIGIFSLFIDFGINAVFLKHDKEEKEFFSLVFLRLLIALSVVIFLQILLFFLPYNPITLSGFSPQEKMYISFMSLLLMIYAFSHSLNALFQKKLRLDLQVWPTLGLAACILIGGVVGYITHILFLFFIATIVGWIAYVIISFILVEKTLKLSVFKNIHLNKTYIKSMFKLSLPLGATLFMNVLYVRADTLILSFLRSTQDVGVYTLAYKFFDFPLTLSSFLMNALYPLFLKAKSENKEVFDALIKKYFLLVLLFSLGISLFAYIGAPLIGLIKSDFQSGIIPFRILILSYPIFFVSNFILWIVITQNKEKFLPFIYGASLVCNVVLNTLLIPRFGYMASAVITVVSEGLVLVLLLMVLFRKK
jgi:O-antigen/teichoic acid export membrane protein